MKGIYYENFSESDVAVYYGDVDLMKSSHNCLVAVQPAALAYGTAF